MKEIDRYLKIVEWSDEDQCYIGSIPGWIGQCCHGDNEKDVYSELCQISKEWVDIYNDDSLKLPNPTNKKYSGKFQLRLGSDLHKLLSFKALQTGESINQLCINIIKKHINV